MENKIFCIIVTYNARKWIDKCLGSIRNSSLKIYPVIVDNGSVDDTVEYVKNNYPEVNLIVNTVNRGFGQANNQGIEFSYKNGATHFFLLNQDAWIVNKDCILKLVSIQEQYALDVVSPIHLTGDASIFDFGFYNYVSGKEESKVFFSDIYLNKQKPYYTFTTVNAAAWLIRRKTIEEIGGFDPLFFHYGEDNNYIQRLLYHKRIFAIIPSSQICHDREQKGNIAIYSKRFIISQLLKEFANINEQKYFSLRRVRLVLFLIKQIFINLLRFDFVLFLDQIKSIFKIIGMAKEISNSRKINKTINHNWLEI